MDCPLCLSDACRFYFEEAAHLGPRKFWECDVCGVIFLDPALRLNQAESKQRYDFHQNSPADPRYRAFLNRLLVPLQAYLRPGACGLDYGCGPGPAIRFILEEHGLEVANFDPIYFPDDALLDARYDFITCTEVLEHLGNPREEFRKIRSMLKEGKSYLGIMTDFFQEGYEFKQWHYKEDPTHICFYRPHTFEWVAQWMGWQLEIPRPNVVIFSSK